MNRNNFLPHVAIALVLILVAAFAGQVRNWRRHWRSHRRQVVMRPYVNPAREQVEQQKTNKTELFVRFRAGVSEERIQIITERLHDRIEDQTEAVSGLDLIEDEDGKDAEVLLEEYRALPEVEYAEPIFDLKLDEAAHSFKPVVPNHARFS